MGNTGVQGNTGVAGVTGVTGITGNQGPAGGIGATGPVGNTGATGPSGQYDSFYAPNNWAITALSNDPNQSNPALSVIPSNTSTHTWIIDTDATASPNLDNGAVPVMLPPATTVGQVIALQTNHPSSCCFMHIYPNGSDKILFGEFVAYAGATPGAHSDVFMEEAYWCQFVSDGNHIWHRIGNGRK
jgi:hypothetical protein